MQFIDIIEDFLVGKEIDITKFLIEVDDDEIGVGIRYTKEGEITSQYAKVKSVYEIFDESFVIGVHAEIKDKRILFNLSEDDEIIIKE